jgi:Transcriptional regulatory protein, C terminal
MAQPIRSANVVRFEMFEVDLRAQELYKAGRKIKLQIQPFQVLAMLLERPGEVVTRDEMQKRLWPVDTFVDFDHSVNTAVKKLRQALGDDKKKPRFGYREKARDEFRSCGDTRCRACPCQRCGCVFVGGSRGKSLLRARTFVRRGVG